MTLRRRASSPRRRPCSPGDEHIVGIVTDRDLALCLAHGQDGALAIAEATSADVVTMPDDADVHDAAATMDSHGVRRLPVADEDGRPVGIICLHDLYNYLTQEAITLNGAVRAQGVPQPEMRAAVGGRIVVQGHQVGEHE
jgi:signal-transduction protein with cAMP-binding, CBS, and nucleotidyltransferase domain